MPAQIGVDGDLAVTAHSPSFRAFSFAAAQSDVDGDLALTAHPLSFCAFSLVSSRAESAQPRDPGSFSFAAAQSDVDGDLAVPAQSGVDGDLALTAHPLSFRAFSLVSSRAESALVSSRAESAQPRDPGSFSFAAAQSDVDGDLALTAHPLSFRAFSLLSSRPASSLVSSRAESAQPRDPGSFSFASRPWHLRVRESQCSRLSTPPSPHCSEGAGAGPCSLANE